VRQVIRWFQACLGTQALSGLECCKVGRLEVAGGESYPVLAWTIRQSAKTVARCNKKSDGQVRQGFGESFGWGKCLGK